MHEADGDMIAELTEDLIAGRLSQQDSRLLSRALQESPGATSATARVLMIHGMLAGRATEPERALVAIKARIRWGTSGTVRAEVQPNRRRLLWAAGLAALLLIAAGVGLHVAMQKPVARETPPARLVSGSIEGLTAETNEIPRGRQVSTGAAPAELLCGDGSRIQLELQSIVTVHGADEDDRWRIELAGGGIRCTVPDGRRPFRVSTPLADVVTEGTQFAVRIGEDAGGTRALLVGVTEGTVRVERPGLPFERLAVGNLRVFPPPSAGDQAARLALRLLFPGEPIESIELIKKGGRFEIGCKIGEGGVEAKVTPGGTVLSCSREFSSRELPEALPENIRRAIEARHGADIQWDEAEVEFIKGTTLYEVEIRVRGKEHELKLDSDGRFIKEND